MSDGVVKFENLRAKVKAQAEKEFLEHKAYIENGGDVWPDAGIERYGTAIRWKQYKDKDITRGQAVSYALKRMAKEVQDRENDLVRKIERVENAGTLISANISVEWKYSRIWNMNPQATVSYTFKVDNIGYEANRNEGSVASGCGYDKMSSTIASALNGCPEILKPLYILANAHPDKELEKLLGYGSGYGPLPYFEGAVGTNCYYNIFKSCGYTMREVTSGKTYNAFTIVKAE